MSLSEQRGRIAVIIVNWNAGDWLTHCIQGLQGQTRQPDRIIIADNGSTDDSLDAIRKQFIDLPGLELLELHDNLGFARANNLAVKLAHDCEWIALLNPDAVPVPTWLERLHEAAMAQPECASFASKLLKMEDHSIYDGAGDVYHVSGRYWRRFHGAPVKAADEEPEEVFAACAAAAFYRRHAFVDIGGFDESFFCYGEDVDLGFRLQLKGYRCKYVPQAVAYHAGSAITGKHSDFTVYHAHRNLVWCWVKNMPSPWIYIYLPYHVLINVATLFKFALRGQLQVILKSKYDAIKGLCAIWRARKEIQKSSFINSARIMNRMAHGAAGFLAAPPD